VADTRARVGAPARFDEALDIFTGAKRTQVQQPILFHYPELPAVSFYDRALFPWLPGARGRDRHHPRGAGRRAGGASASSRPISPIRAALP
jgi:hypothetical protein